jgi:hypothetical protein
MTADLRQRLPAKQVLSLHVFTWQEANRNAGFVRDALYLLRPDTYIALVDSHGSVDVVKRYFAERGLRV